MQKKIYRILQIYEDDYGCEARPDDYVPMVQVQIQTVNTDSGGEFEKKFIRIEDSLLYERDLKEGDFCVTGADGGLYPVPEGENVTCGKETGRNGNRKERTESII